LERTPALVHDIVYGLADLNSITLRYGPTIAAVVDALQTTPRAMVAVVQRVVLRCEACRSVDDLRVVGSRTAYNWDGRSDIDPNHPLLLCPTCAQEHDAHWDAMWAEYYAGIM